LAKRYPGDNPFKDRFILMAGLNGASRMIAKEIQRHKGNAIIASNDKKSAAAVAAEAGCRFIAFDALYTTMHDVLVVCDEEKDEKVNKTGIHPGYLKDGMLVLDMTANTQPSELLKGAKARGCDIVQPLELLLDLLELQAKTLTGKAVPRDVIRPAIPERFLAEE
jgi:shikimate 5-dehydrogenase